MEKQTVILEDVKINVRIKLAALWTAVMFCYIYGDFFTLFVPGRIENLMSNKSGIGTTTPCKLLLFAVLMTLPAAMIFLSLMLKPKASRLINISVAILFTAVMVLVVVTSIDRWMIFYTYLGMVEITITSLIIWHAWRWQKQ